MCGMAWVPKKKKKKTPVNYRCKRNNRRSLVL
jgi:hypothetical protein